MTNQHCKAKGDGDRQFECGGHAVMRTFRAVFNFYSISFSRSFEFRVNPMGNTTSLGVQTGLMMTV